MMLQRRTQEINLLIVKTYGKGQFFNTFRWPIYLVLSTACRSLIAIASHTNPVKTPHALCAFLSLIIFTMQGCPDGRFSHIYRATILQIWPHFISFKVEGRGYQPPFYALIFCELFSVMKSLAENVLKCEELIEYNCPGKFHFSIFYQRTQIQILPCLVPPPSHSVLLLRLD